MNAGNMQADIWTYDDLIGHALDYMGAATDAQTERFARRAVQLAYSQMKDQRNWTYYYQIGRITTVAPTSTGTISYSNSTRIVTLTGDTWPSWAADGSLVISNVIYPVISRLSDTEILLGEANNPGNDVSAGTSFTFFRDTYTLPVDFGAMDSVYRMSGAPFSLTYLTPGNFLASQVVNVGPSEPLYYTVISDPNRYGVLAIKFRPGPSSIFPFNFVYRRRPRTLRINKNSDGKTSLASASTTVTGFGTSFTADMIGAMARFSDGADNIPTGISGDNPFWLERSITDVTSATSLTIDSVPGQDLTKVAFSISDPVDIESGAMMTYLLREVERQCRAVKRMKVTSPEENAVYELSLRQAMEADSRRFESNSAQAGLLFGSLPLKYGKVLPDTV